MGNTYDFFGLGPVLLVLGSTTEIRPYWSVTPARIQLMAKNCTIMWLNSRSKLMVQCDKSGRQILVTNKSANIWPEVFLSDWTDIHQWLNTWFTIWIGDGIRLHAVKFKNPKIKFKKRIFIVSETHRLIWNHTAWNKVNSGTISNDRFQV